LPDDKAKQSATQSFVNNISYQYPAIAAPWAATLSDPNQRNNAIENVARNWLQSDTAAAKDWLSTTSLPDDRKARLLQRYSK
jgi:hypothetical protein